MSALVPTQPDEWGTLFALVASTTRSAILQNHAVNSCIETARLGKKVLDRLGIASRVQPVRVVAMNRLAYDLRNAGLPLEHWPEQAYASAIGYATAEQMAEEPERASEGWNGHMVIVTKPPWGGRHVMDASIDQLSRPPRMVIDKPVGMLIREGELWTPQDPLYRLLEHSDGIIDYRPFAPGDPVGREYLDFPAWTADEWWFDSMADQIVEFIKTTLNEET